MNGKNKNFKLFIGCVFPNKYQLLQTTLNQAIFAIIRTYCMFFYDNQILVL